MNIEEGYKISVAMATYNGEKHILKQLESIRCQSRQPDEVIICDDNSTDDTYNIVASYIKKHSLSTYRLIKNKLGKGVYSNFYSAIKETTGDIVLLCDQDDVWMEYKIATIENAFLINPSIACLNTGFEYIDENDALIHDKRERLTNHGMIKKRIRKGECENISFPHIINKNISPGMTMAIKREIIDTYLDISTRDALHDWELNCIAGSVGGVYFLNETLTQYRIHDLQTVSIAYLNNRLLERIQRKIRSSKNDIRMRIIYLNEISNIVSENASMKIMIQRYLEIMKVRYDVAISHKWWKIGKLIVINIHASIWDKYFDNRLLCFDIISCLNRN